MANSRLKAALQQQARDKELAEEVSSTFAKTRNYKYYERETDPDDFRRDDGLVSYYDFGDGEHVEPEPVPEIEKEFYMRNLDGNIPTYISIEHTEPIEYSLDGGKTWIPYDSGGIILTQRDGVSFRGTLSATGTHFNIDGCVSLGGNIISLLREDFAEDFTLPSEGIFENLFSDCTGIYRAESLILPSRDMTARCYCGMFSGCENLTTIPSDMLQVNMLADNCFDSMFSRCVNLRNMPKLTFDNMADGACAHMFEECKSITRADVRISVSTLPQRSLYEMFKGCGGLYYVPSNIIANVKNTEERALFGMFRDCRSLKSTPMLDLSGVHNGIENMNYMFCGCSELEEIWCMYPSIKHDPTTLFNYWARGVAENGVFHAAEGAVWNPGESGDPWKPFPEHIVITCDPNKGSVAMEPDEAVKGEWITISATPKEGYRFKEWSDGNSENPRRIYVTGPISLEAIFEWIPQETFWILPTEPDTTIKLVGHVSSLANAAWQLSVDGGEHWFDWDGTAVSVPQTKINFKRVLYEADWNQSDSFVIEGDYSLGGNLSYLVNGTESAAFNLKYAFYNMFSYSDVTDISEIVWPSEAPADNTFNAMFSECHKLESTGDFSITNLGAMCMSQMFSGCYLLMEGPSVLPEVNLGIGVYNSMFANTNLYKSPTMLFENVENDSCAYMFGGCDHLSMIEVPKCVYTEEKAGAFENWALNVAEEGVFIEPEGKTWPRGASGNPWRKPPVDINITIDENMGEYKGPTEAEIDDLIVIEAVPKDGYRFVNWSDGDDHNPRTILVTEEVNLVANMEKDASLYITSASAYWGTALYNSMPSEYYEYRQYAVDDGLWQDWTDETGDIYLNHNQKLWIRRKLVPSKTFGMSDCDRIYTQGTQVGGSIRSFYDGVGNFEPFEMTHPYALYGLFEGVLMLETLDDRLLEAVSSVADYGLANMFFNCNHLTNVPDLSHITHVGEYGMSSMFEECAELKLVSSLPQSDTSKNCFMYMFANCPKLEVDSSVEVTLPAEHVAERAYMGMFKASNIASTPIILASSADDHAMAEMMDGCGKLTAITISNYEWTEADTEKGTFENWARDVFSVGEFYGSSSFPKKDVSANPWGFVLETPVLYFTNPTAPWTLHYRYWGADYNVVFQQYRVNKTGEWHELLGSYHEYDFNAGDIVEVRRQLKSKPDWYGFREGTRFQGTYTIIGGDVTWFNTGGLDFDDNLEYVYGGWFEYSTHLEDVSNLILPATGWTEKRTDTQIQDVMGTYEGMFKGCIQLKNASFTLPHEFVTRNGYHQMFKDCKILEEPPIIKAKEAYFEGAFEEMFDGCTKLNKLHVQDLDWHDNGDYLYHSESNGTAFINWCRNVAAEGTFENKDADGWISGKDGNPWKQPNRYDYLWLRCLEDNEWTLYLSNGRTSSTGINPEYKYKIGINGDWQEFKPYEHYTIPAKEYIFLSRKTNWSYMEPESNHWDTLYYHYGYAIPRMPKMEIGGDISTFDKGKPMRDYSLSECSCYNLFAPNDEAYDVDLSELWLHGNVSRHAFAYMFHNQRYLNSVPIFDFAKASVAQGGFKYMFDGCVSLQKVPNLEFYTLNGGFEKDEYGNNFECMFRYCQQLQGAAKIVVHDPNGRAPSNAFSEMFKECDALKSARIEVADYSEQTFLQMFYNCVSLQYCTLETQYMEPANQIPSGAFLGMFGGCNALLQGIYLAGTPWSINEACQSMYEGCQVLHQVFVNASGSSTIAPTNFMFGCPENPTDYESYEFHLGENQSIYTRGWRVIYDL